MKKTILSSMTIFIVLLCLTSILASEKVKAQVQISPTPSFIPPSGGIVGDANHDGHINGIDYGIWLKHNNTDTTRGSTDGDFNRDGKVDRNDFVIWVNNYGLVSQINIYNHQIHSFDVNYSDPSIPETYAYEHRHAYELGYTMISSGKPADSKYSNQSILKDHNAFIIPLDFKELNTPNKKYLYRNSYHKEFVTSEKEYKSAFDPTQYINRKYDITDNIINFIKVYACAKPGADLNRLNINTLNSQLLSELFYPSWTIVDQNGNVAEMSLVVNWQNSTVVNDLINKTINTVTYENVNGIFFDQINGYPDNAQCSNPGNQSYSDWLVGQKVFLSETSQQLRSMISGNGNPYFISANFAHPKILSSQRFAQWYADGSLRFDQYYAEWGNIRDPSTNEIVNSLEANGTDPVTGKPAFINGNGYIPADKVSVDTEVGWYGIIGVLDYGYAGGGYREDDYWNDTSCILPINQDNYFTQHLKACGIAGNQGSWFGYYGEDILHDKDEYICEYGVPRRKTDSEKKLVYTNDLQLLRAIPNWDNLADVPIRISGNVLPSDPRYYDKTNLIYKSTNSFASKDVIYARHFQTKELFVVFKTLNGEVALDPGESVKSAYFVNKYFEKTIDDAGKCLIISQNKIKLDPACSNKLGIGIRISSNMLPFENGLVAYWNFDEGSGTILHDSISGINGSIKGGLWEAGKIGTSLKFNGINDMINFQDSLNMESSDLSISFWIKTTMSTNASIITKAWDIPYYDLAVWKGKLVMSLHNGQLLKKFASVLSVNDNNWHHVAAVWKRNENMSIYIDGILDSFMDISADKGTLITNNNLFTMGTNCKYENLCGEKFMGNLDEVKFFNKALSGTEINSLMNSSP